MHAANMLLEAKRWIEATHPAAWNRRGGRDHIWLIPNDEGVLSVTLPSCRVSLRTERTLLNLTIPRNFAWYLTRALDKC